MSDTEAAKSKVVEPNPSDPPVKDSSAQTGESNAHTPKPQETIAKADEVTKEESSDESKSEGHNESSPTANGTHNEDVTKSQKEEHMKLTPNEGSMEEMEEEAPKPKVRKTFFDLRDYATFWSRIDTGFHKERSPGTLIQYLRHAYSALEKAMNNELSEEHIDYLEKTALRTVIVAAVNRAAGNWPLELKADVNRFLQLAVQFILDHLQSENVNHLCQALHRIYFSNLEYCPFWGKAPREELPPVVQNAFLPSGMSPTGNNLNEVDTSTMSQEAIEEAIKKTTSWVRIGKGERTLSPFYFANINYFGSLGGFQRIYKLIETQKMSIFTLKLHVKVLCSACPSVSLTFIKLFLPGFVDLVFNKLLEWFGVNLKPDARNHYNDTIEYLQIMMCDIMTEEQAFARIDQYQLTGCLMMFKTDNLERRLRGLRDLKVLIDRTQKNEERRFAAVGKFFAGQVDDEDEKKKKKAPRLQPKVLLDWLNDTNFIQLLFSMLQSHIEILRQGTPVLIFLAQHGQLDISYLNNLWSLADGMYEHDKRVLNSSLVALVPHLPPSHIDHLITQISSSPLQSMDEQVVDLIVSLTTLSVAADTKHKWNGLELLWKLCQDPEILNAPAAFSAMEDSSSSKPKNASGMESSRSDTEEPKKKKKQKDNSAEAISEPLIDPLLAHKAFTKLCDLLSTEECASQRGIYMERCFTNIERHRSIAISFEIMRRCIDAHAVKRRKKAVSDLETGQRKLMNLIFDDFKFYKQVAQSVCDTERERQTTLNAASATSQNASSNNTLAPPNGKKHKKKASSGEDPSPSRPTTPNGTPTTAAAPLDINSIIIHGRPHLANVRQKLMFLKYIIINTGLSMTVPQVDALWDLFITQALSSQEREAMFGWLEGASSTSNSNEAVVLSESQLQYLFNNKMLKMGANQLTQAGYQLFERYFCRINDSQAKIKFIEENNDKSIGLISPDAIGLDQLWEIALNNEDRNVSVAAIACLNQLHLNLENFSNRTKAIKLRESYVQHALEKLVSAKANGETRKILQCLRLLHECVSDFEELKGETAVARNAGTTSGILSGWLGDVFTRKPRNAQVATTIKLFVKSPGKSPQRLILSTQTTIRSIIEKSIELFNFDAFDTLELRLEDDKDKEFKELDKTLGDYRVPDDATVIVRKMAASMENASEEGPPIFSQMIRSLLFGIGGVGGRSESAQPIIARADALYKQALLSNSKPTTSNPQPSKSPDPTSPFPPLIRSNCQREIYFIDRKIKEVHPARILCTPQCFTKIYDLLKGSDESVGEAAWSLMTMLPKSESTISEIIAATNVSNDNNIDWNKHLPLDEPFQLLYNLQILEYLISYANDEKLQAANAATPNTSTQLPVNVQWVNNIVQSGLLTHLFDKLFKIKIKGINTSIGTLKLLPQLLRVINLLALENNPAPSGAPSLQGSGFIHMDQLKSNRTFCGFRLRAAFAKQFKSAKSSSTESFLLELISKLLPLISTMACSSSNTSAEPALDDEALTVQEALTLLIPSVVSTTDTLRHFIEDSGLPDWLLKLLLKASNQKIRECGVFALNELVHYTTATTLSTAIEGIDSSSDSKHSPSLILLHLITPALDDLQEIDQYATSCDQYFSALQILIKEVSSVPYYGVSSSNQSSSTSSSVASPTSKKDKKEKLLSKDLVVDRIPAPRPILQSLVKTICTKIESRPVVEKFAASGYEDRVLIGLMQAVHAIVRRDGAAIGKRSVPLLYKPSCRSLVKELFHNCLFAIPTAELRGPQAPPKCKTKASRTVAYALLTELCSHCSRNLNVALQLLQKQVATVDMGNDYYFYAGRNDKSTTGYVGLKNQGATCYMNATMQQLYMVKEFRQAILDASDQWFDDPLESVLKLPPEKKKKRILLLSDSSSEESEEAPIQWSLNSAIAKLEKESLLFQLQKMFAYLQEGEKRSFDTQQYCHAYKDFEGNPVNTSQQMDANEYYNRLFESLETKLAGTPQAKILQRIFGGKYANQLLGHGSECHHRRESTEPFYSISVDIKHKTSLQESLKSFTEGELLNGENKFQCSICGKPVDTLKRCLMHSLPPILVIHLKRFDFHFEQMKHFKLNSMCSFPMELDMMPYTREFHAKTEALKANQQQQQRDADSSTAEMAALAAEDQMESLADLAALADERKATGYYDFELSGVVVHVGTSDAGHYYSFIKERPEALPFARVMDSTVGTKWFEFNDSSVTEFDPAKIPLECFGGDDEVLEWADQTRTTKRLVKRPRQNNAYILIYQRKTSSNPIDGAEHVQGEEAIKSTAPDSNISNSIVPASTSIPSPEAVGTGMEKEEEVEEISRATLTKSQRAKSNTKPTDASDSPAPSAMSERTSQPIESPALASAPTEAGTESNASTTDGKVTDCNIENPSDEPHHDDKIESKSSEKRDEESKVAGSNSADAAHPEEAKVNLANAIEPKKENETDTVPTSSSSKLSKTVKKAPENKHKGSSEILKSILEENKIFITKKQLFDPEYFNFVWAIVGANLPPVPPRTPDEIRRERDEIQRKTDSTRMQQERRELRLETNGYPSPFVIRSALANISPPPGSRTLTIGSGTTSIKVEVRAVNNSLQHVRAEESKRRKEEEKKKLREKDMDADDAKLEQDKKAEAAEKTSKEKKQAEKNSKESKEDGGKSKKSSKDKEKGSSESSSMATTESKKGSKEANGASNVSNSASAAATTSTSATTGTNTSSELNIPQLSASADLEAKTTKADLTTFTIDFIKNIYVYTRETPLLPLWLSTVYRLFATNLNQARYFLKSLIFDPEALATLVIHNRSEKARSCHAQLIVAAMRALAPEERSHYVATAIALRNVVDGYPETDPPSICVWFLEEMWKQNKAARKQYFDMFFYIFAQFANFGPVERKYLMQRSFLKEFVAFAQYFEPSSRRRPLISMDTATSQLFHVLDLISTLLTSCEHFGDEEESEDQPPTLLDPDHPLILDEPTYKEALGTTFLTYVMRDDINSHAVGKIMCHFCWNHKDMVKHMMQAITKGINSNHTLSVKGFMDVLASVVRNLDDKNNNERMEKIINEFKDWIRSWRSNHKSGAEHLIHSFLIIATLTPNFRAKVMQNKDSLNEILDSAGYKIL